MEDRIRINRTGERFSSHTQTRPHASADRTSQDTGALRHKLIEASVAIIAEGSDPRLGKSRARA
jgi:hypothetical protein